MSEPILDPFRRQLVAQINADIESHVAALASGGAFTEGAKTTAENYAHEVGYLQAMYAVLRVAETIEREQMGAGVRSATVQYR